MRNWFLLFVTLICFTATAQDEKSFVSLNNKTVLSRLFDKVTYNAQQEALWKPNYAERINMPVSDDGFCHTILDTTIYYKSGNTKNAILIFATYEYERGQKVSCHACAPTLSIATFTRDDDDNWQISQFKKDFIRMGAWGRKLGHWGIEKLGEDFYGLKVQSAIDGNQGYERGITTLYSLNSYDQFKEIFSFIYYDSNEGAMEEGKGVTEEKIMKVTPASDSYFGIELNTKRTGQKNVTRKYKYSEEERHYIP